MGGFGNMTAGGFMGFPSVGGTIFNAAESNAANAFDSQQAQDSRTFEMQMSDTAYQRQVADMKAAGINPILSAQTGGGASTPSAPMASASVPQWVSMPDMYKAFQTDRQLDQADQQIGIQKKSAAASAAKDMSQRDLNMTDTLLKQEGVFGREAGTGGVQKFKNFLQNFQNNVKNPDPNGTMVPPQP